MNSLYTICSAPCRRGHRQPESPRHTPPDGRRSAVQTDIPPADLSRKAVFRAVPQTRAPAAPHTALSYMGAATASRPQNLSPSLPPRSSRHKTQRSGPPLQAPVPDHVIRSTPFPSSANVRKSCIACFASARSMPGVGSSAMIRRGCHISAVSKSTRRAMPPDSSNG